MTRIFILVNFIVLVLPCYAQEKEVRFLALGDSYTIGESVDASKRWPQQLADSLGIMHADIIAQTGWRTDDLMESIRMRSLEHNYDVVSLLIGVNNQYQGTPMKQYEQEFVELLTIAKKLAKKENSTVFVLSIPDYYYTPFGHTNRTDQVSKELNAYNTYAEAICASQQIPFVNITDISRLGLKRPELVASDGLHPSAIQYSMWVQRIIDTGGLKALR
ncbi:MAG: SGNH/GDSL hydrolase family protein [Salibacteraceae bacterium]